MNDTSLRMIHLKFKLSFSVINAQPQGPQREYLTKPQSSMVISIYIIIFIVYWSSYFFLFFYQHDTLAH